MDPRTCTYIKEFMIGTLTWHFYNCVTIGIDEDKCEHAVYREYENLEIMLHDIRKLQHRPFVEPDYDNEIKFHEYLSPYSLWTKISNIEHKFDYYPTAGDEIFFVEYDGYIWDCTDINRLRQVKNRLIKELKV